MHRTEKKSRRTKKIAMSSPTVKKRQKLSNPMRCACSKVSSDERASEQKEKNKEINRILQRDKQTYRNTHRIVMMGPAKSGKTTISKQLSLFAPSHEKVLRVKMNVRDAILAICSDLKTLNPPVLKQNTQHQHYVNFIISEAVNYTSDEDFSDDFYDRVESIWQDNRIQKCCEKRTEYDFNTVKYLLDRVPIIRQTDYYPSEQDLIMCKMPGDGMRETKFQIEKVKFVLLEPNQRLQNQRYMRFFNEVTAIIFVVDSSAYDYDKHTKGSLKEGLDMFKKIWHDRWMRTTSFILLLNKIDLLERKVLGEKNRLEDYYPDFLNYNLPQDFPSSSELENPLFTRAKYFIRDEFLRVSQTREQGCTTTHAVSHYCYPHFICGLDAENLHLLVMSDCRDIIQRMHLRQYELL